MGLEGDFFWLILLCLVATHFCFKAQFCDDILIARLYFLRNGPMVL
uniref:Uncharacterized protein n=1 Tax=Rhizophora mucronata TaxID=61149 RepID=A0A2P2Q770_RHIMU